MIQKSTIRSLTIAALGALALLGCMKRKETLTIAPDGGVRMQLAYEADSRDELYGGDAMPTTESGWQTDLTVETDKEGKETHKLTAEAAFAPGAVLPDSYAAASDPQAHLALRFPTTITREERSDGTYYHFRRVYPRRAWAQVETLRKMRLDANEQVKAVSEKDAGEVTHEDRVALAKALAEASIFNMTAFARAAFLDVTPDAAQDGWLRAESGLRPLVESLDFERIANLMESNDKEQGDQALTAEAEALETAALNGMVAALRESGYDDRQAADFLDRYNGHKRYYDITGDLGDDSFEIAVEMPGEIVATDMFADTKGNQAEWMFDGQWFRDRDLELMATLPRS